MNLLVERKTAGNAAELAKPVLYLAAAALVLVTAFALSARLWWVFDLFSHFRLQYLVAALVLCLAALALGTFRIALVLALIALVHGWTIKDLWLGGTTAAAAQAGIPLRIAASNVLDENETPEKVEGFIRASDADLVVVVDARQESWREVLVELGTLYPHRAPESWRDGEPIILLSRHPILRARVVRPPDGRRPYLMAEVALGDRALKVVGVHASSPRGAGDSRRRNRELAHIAKSVRDAGRPAIVAGDLNTSPWSPSFEDFLDAGGLRNAALGRGYIATWPHRVWPAQIPLDHILLKGPLAVTAIRRGPAIGSDHYPIIADLRLANG